MTHLVYLAAMGGFLFGMGLALLLLSHRTNGLSSKEYERRLLCIGTRGVSAGTRLQAGFSPENLVRPRQPRQQLFRQIRTAAALAESRPEPADEAELILMFPKREP